MKKKIEEKNNSIRLGNIGVLGGWVIIAFIFLMSGVFSQIALELCIFLILLIIYNHTREIRIKQAFFNDDIKLILSSLLKKRKNTKKV